MEESRSSTPEGIGNGNHQYAAAAPTVRPVSSRSSSMYSSEHHAHRPATVHRWPQTSADACVFDVSDSEDED